MCTALLPPALRVFVRTCEKAGEALASEPRNDGRERSGPNKHMKRWRPQTERITNSEPSAAQPP